MLRRFAAPLLVLLPVLLVLGCENNLLEPDLRGAIEGQVFDFDTREPLSGVNITTNPPTGSLITDENGSFRLDDLPVGNYSIAGRRSGYDSNSITISVLDGETRTAVLLLEEASEDDTTATTRNLEASVLGFSNRFRGDSTFAVVEYRVRNTGDEAIPVYELYFQLLTTGRTYFQEVDGTDLGVGQSDIGQFEKFVERDTVTAVEIGGVFFEGQ